VSVADTKGSEFLMHAGKSVHAASVIKTRGSSLRRGTRQKSKYNKRYGKENYSD